MSVKLAFPEYPFKLKSEGNKTLVFDELRKKWVVLTKEENVRQHLWKYLHHQYKYPKSLMIAEKKVTVNSLTKRFDLLIFNNNGQPEIIVECKAPEIKITNDTLEQVLRYNINIKAKYLILTNGVDLQCCEIDYKKGALNYLKYIPAYQIN
ncbi:MAG: type I restriction enzyme HsdR N-terminal domain-containing protein [Parvicellaceae bacterium]